MQLCMVATLEQQQEWQQPHQQQQSTMSSRGAHASAVCMSMCVRAGDGPPPSHEDWCAFGGWGVGTEWGQGVRITLSSAGCGRAHSADASVVLSHGASSKGVGVFPPCNKHTRRACAWLCCLMPQVWTWQGPTCAVTPSTSQGLRSVTPSARTQPAVYSGGSRLTADKWCRGGSHSVVLGWLAAAIAQCTAARVPSDCIGCSLLALTCATCVMRICVCVLNCVRRPQDLRCESARANSVSASQELLCEGRSFKRPERLDGQTQGRHLAG